MVIVIFRFLLESTASKLHWSIAVRNTLASVTIGCKPFKVTILTVIVAILLTLPAKFCPYTFQDKNLMISYKHSCLFAINIAGNVFELYISYRKV